jgi:hypothetical protein
MVSALFNGRIILFLSCLFKVSSLYSVDDRMINECGQLVEKELAGKPKYSEKARPSAAFSST